MASSPRIVDSSGNSSIGAAIRADPPPRRSAPMQKLYSFLAQNEGQTMAEYAIVLTVITIGCLAAFALLAAASSGAIGKVAALLT
jgi:Flp pilus assembly pilin Flp